MADKKTYPNELQSHQQRYPLLEDEEVQELPPQRLTPSSRFWRFVAQPTLFFILGSVSTGIALSLIQRTPQYSSTLGADALSSLTTQSPGQLLKTPVPEIPWEVKYFQPNETFQSRQSWDSGVAWNLVLPPGRGFVYVDAPESYSLLPGEHTPWGEIYSTSLFHQLHCLVQIRTAYEAMSEAFETDDVRHGLYLIGKTQPHVGHCLDYLRQGIMCAGDLSLEWPKQEGTGEGFAVDGWGVPHVCRSWDAIMEYMDVAHFNQSISSDAAG